MQLARHVGQWSKDRSRKVGCVIVDSDNQVRALGYNGFPRNIDEHAEERHERPSKYLWTEHAERNTIYSAARLGVPLKGCRMYVPWFPCMDCARAIVQVGVTELIAFQPDFNDPRWGSDFRSAIELFQEAGVSLRWYIDNTPASGG
jgi:dCMP deaminase